MIHIIGDIHGEYCALIKLLQRETQLIDDSLQWSGGEATLCFLGDYFDRGPAGIETIDFIMRLQDEARDAGGEVIALLGNHDISLLAAYHFGDIMRKRQPRSFIADWKRYGGQMADLDNLTQAHVDWLTTLPAMARLDDMVLVHADSMLYTTYGETVEQVNARFRMILQSDDPPSWDNLIEDFGEKFAFKPGLIQTLRGGESKNAREFLWHFGGSQIVHGHTPVYRFTNQSADQVTDPLIYSNGMAVNVDGCLYNNGPGIVYDPLKVMIV